jgi:hypothetical protein
LSHQRFHFSLPHSIDPFRTAFRPAGALATRVLEMEATKRINSPTLRL